MIIKFRTTRDVDDARETISVEEPITVVIRPYHLKKVWRNFKWQVKYFFTMTVPSLCMLCTKEKKIDRQMRAINCSYINNRQKLLAKGRGLTI